MTIDSFSFDSKDTFPSIETVVHATVYLAPKAEGVTAGATPQGPAGAAPQAPGQTASSVHADPRRGGDRTMTLSS